MYGISAPENIYDYKEWQEIFNKYDSSDSSSISQQNQKDISELYQQFLKTFPQLHIYWAKFANFQMMASGDIKDAIDVFEQALSPEILLNSLDMWREYIKFIATHMQDDPNQLRQIYARALDAIGWHFKSGTLWLEAIQLELQSSRNPFFYYVKSILQPTNELVRLYKEFQTIIPKTTTEFIKSIDLDMPLLKYIELGDVPMNEQIVAAEEDERLKLLSTYAVKYERSTELCREIIQFENQITRDYFHFIAPDEAQISVWEQYSTWAIEGGKNDLAVRLFERAVIPCAHIDAIWLEYAFFLEDLGNIDAARAVYKRMPLGILHRGNEYYAAFEESQNPQEAQNIYSEMTTSSFADEIIAAANFYQRHSDNDTAASILMNAQGKFVEREDFNGAGVVNARLMDLQWPVEPVAKSAASIIKYCERAADEDINNILFAAVFNEPAEVCIEDRVALASLYFQYARLWKIDINFQYNIETTVESLKSKILWYRYYFNQHEIMSQVSPEKIEEDWINYQESL